MRRVAFAVWLGLAMNGSYAQTKLTITPLEAVPNPNLLRNASFEQVENNLPVGWSWDKRNTDSAVQVVSEPGATGQVCLKFTNTTPFGADVYGLMRYEGGVAVQPGAVYTLSCRYKTREGYAGFIGGGEGWRVRLPLEDTRGLWKRAEITFATKEKESTFELVIVIEAPTDGVWIDAVKLEAGSRATPFTPAETPERPIVTIDDLGEQVFLNETQGRVGFEIYTAQPLRNAQIEAQLGDQRARQRVNLNAGHARAEFVFRAPSEPDQTLRFQIRQGRQTLATVERPLRFFTRTLAEKRLQDLAAQLPQWETQIQQARASGQDIAYPQASLTILQEFIRYVGEDLQKGQVQRAYQQLDEMERVAARLNQMLANALSGAKPLPTVPRYVTSPVEIRGASLIAETEDPLTGARERRPVFFVGFGHFGQVRADIEKFPKMGFNLIQIERGVWDILPEEGKVNLKPFEEDVLPALRRAAAANVKVDYLISPHYMPQWVYQKYPHLKQPRDGFIQYSLFAPESLEVLRQYIDSFAPLLKDQPALLSICLSNEPLNKESPESPPHQQAWRTWLQNRHKNLLTLNTRWKTNYQSWDEIPIPDEEAGVRYAEWQDFNAEALANWHRELAKAIERHLPGVPKHSKLMSWTFTNDRELSRGVDPERFAAFCELNGNDAATYPNWDKGAPWAFGWVTTMLAHEIQRSLRDAPVFNSENHIIRDRETRYVPPQHARAVLWEEAIRGLSATTFWVWERTDDPKSDFAGSLLHRPEIVEALSHTTLDLNRLAPYIAALQNQKPDVYLLYSQYDMMMQGADAVVPRDSLYIALTMLGVRVGFITERQLEARRLPEGVSRIIVANTQYLSDEAFAGLELLRQQRGIQLLGFGEPSLQFDRYGRARTSRPGITFFERNPLTDARRLFLRLPSLLSNWRIERPLRLLDANDQPVWGVSYRVAPYENGFVASLCNYTRNPITVRLVNAENQPITATNLIDGTTVQDTLTLQPLEPVLLKW
ncbi:MAG: beta-galactosidase [Fimbriimonadales bacterium]|nr:beta-galactosidase [Fimbriimonadales bacterium]